MAQEPRVGDVNVSNWLELQAQGFEHLTNIGCVSDVLAPGDLDSMAYFAEVQQRFGPSNVKVGDAINSRTNLPDATFSEKHDLCGVYAKRRS